MQFIPTASEFESLATMPEAGRLEYFLTRTAEVEEVWGLGDDSGWIMRESGETTSLPVWPYRQLAVNSAEDEWQNQVANAVSLEHFIFKVLTMLVDANIMVEIMPGPNSQGQLMDPRELFQLFESIVDSGEYYIEG